MKVIKTKADLLRLREANVLPECYLNFIEGEFKGLMDAFRGDESEEDFSLDEYGPIVLLEKTDNLRDLSSVGLNPQDNGLLGSCPEYVETYDVGVETELLVWKIMVIHTNDYASLFYLEAGIHEDTEVETWLDEQSDCIYRLHPTARRYKKYLSELLPG